jgi:hypothetical protein
MKSSSQTQISRLPVKAAGVLLKLLLAPQQDFTFEEIKQITQIGKSALYGVLHELRSRSFLKYSPPSPGSAAFYQLLVSFSDFQQLSHIHTYKTNTTTDGSDQNGSSKSGNDTLPEPTPCPSQEGNTLLRS